MKTTVIISREKTHRRIWYIFFVLYICGGVIFVPRHKSHHLASMNLRFSGTKPIPSQPTGSYTLITS